MARPTRKREAVQATQLDMPVKYGAEAIHQDIEAAKDRGLHLAKYFKLHLHPADMAPSSGFKLDPLPRGVTINQVYTDYLRYLYAHTRNFFQDHVFHGQQVWQTLALSMEIVLAHPNGWGTREQGVLRSAAVAAGMTTEAKSREQISFVTEAEASVQFCVCQPQTSTFLTSGMNLVVCDAGGSTVDTTVYNVTSAQPTLQLKETKASACIQAGAIFVDDAAESWLRGRFKAAGLDQDDIDACTADGLDHFINFTKPNFSGTEDVLDLKVGKRRLNVASISIQGGRMKVAKSNVKSFFDGCVDRIINSVTSQSSGLYNPYYILVGGFGDSPYLKSMIRTRFGGSNRLTTSNIPGAKAVADGAAIWAVTKSVVSRAARYSYGIPVVTPYDQFNTEHVGRTIINSPSGTRKVGGAWSEIVAKDTVMADNSSVKQSYYQEFSSLHEVPNTISQTLYSTLLSSSYKFMRNKSGVIYSDWTAVCDVSANVQDIKSVMTRKYNPGVGPYFVLDFQIAIHFGGTQLSAHIEWEQNGRTMTGPATVIPASLK
ncbi:heat shock protein 70 kDa 12A [Ceratobasidium sp. AG-Ba]|nr:heat shock protein 70 kDa 12A [Ceratobasidium sp. AG-Ba]QRW09385.1 heat shock protein 70 kDa 12A [Ceratobasidium sp. AG-Ba]